MNISKLEQLINYDFKTKSLIEEASNLSDRLVSLGTSTIEHIILKTINEELYLNSNSYFDNDSINNLINYLKSDEYLLSRTVKIHLDEVIYDKKIELLKAIIGAYIIDSNEYLKLYSWLNIFDSIVLNIESDDNYAKKIYSWSKNKYKEYPNLTFDGTKVSIKLKDIDLSFESVNETKFISLNEASKKAYKYLEDNNLLLKAVDIVGYPDQDMCINQLQELYVKGYINEPIYKFSLKGTSPGGVDIWKCRIMIDGIKESFSADVTSKKNAKRIVALQMLNYLIENEKK